MPSILNNSSTPLTGYGIVNSFTTSLLSAGRKAFSGGAGLSTRAREGIGGFLTATQSGYNQMFSLGVGPSLTIEGLQTQIQGLRAGIPLSRLSPKILEELARQIAEAEAAETSVPPSELGQNVDETA